ncbi:hypothetical protein niasHT_016799 [Heterodera trifolii]|uniref:Sphingomyelin phosphodiesterase n=1 Tax=Heterodera trifolii TaxID=157864 RepID=A0ABD2LH60_9BILA
MAFRRSFDGIFLRIGAFLLLSATSALLQPPAAVNAFPWKCFGCRGGVELLRLLYETNATSDRILSVADFVCRHFADSDSFVCRGITTQFREEFLYVLGRLVISPSQLCALLVTDCGTPLDPFGTNWTVPLPPKVNGTKKFSRPPVPPARPLRILQLSDLHFDRKYASGTEADCAEPVCCVNGTERASPGQTKVRIPAGKWGTLAKCDIPLRTVENMLEHIQRSHEIDFVFLSGDYMDHRDWEYSRVGHLSQLDQLSGLLLRHFDTVPVFWTLGNHEGVPVNAFAPHFVPERFRPQWMYRAMVDAVQRTAARLPKEAERSAIYRGSYMVPLLPGIRLISLNNGYCEKTNMFIYINQTDPDGSLSWLVDQLWEAEKADESAYILAHIPPGDNECLESWSRNYYRIVTRFASSISAQFFGHTHTDSFRLFFEDMNNSSSPALSVLYVAPSVTTFAGLNPAYRVYVASPSDGRILDIENYFLNLTALSDGPEKEEKPRWELLYTAKAEYGMKQLSAEAWNTVAQRIEREPAMARKFNRNYARRNDAECDAHCVAERVCEIRAAHSNKTALCGGGRKTRSKLTPRGKVPSSAAEKRKALWKWTAHALAAEKESNLQSAEMS